MSGHVSESETWVARTQGERLVLAHFRLMAHGRLMAHDRQECPACAAQEAHYSAGFGAAQGLAAADFERGYSAGYDAAIDGVASGD